MGVRRAALLLLVVSPSACFRNWGGISPAAPWMPHPTGVTKQSGPRTPSPSGRGRRGVLHERESVGRLRKVLGGGQPRLSQRLKPTVARTAVPKPPHDVAKT